MGFDWLIGEGGVKYALNCDFPGNDIGSIKIGGDKCGKQCIDKDGCTNFAWTNYQGGTCWFKQGSLSTNDAVPNSEPGSVCGIVSKNSE